MLSRGIALIYGFIVDDRTRITMNILVSPIVNYGTILYVNQGPFRPSPYMRKAYSRVKRIVQYSYCFRIYS